MERSSSWNEAYKEAVRAISLEDHVKALRLIADFLAETESDLEIRTEALSVRSLVMENLGRLSDAIADAELAAALSQPGSYSKYSFELSVGRLRRLAGDLGGALEAYLRALQTAYRCSTPCGSSAVSAMLDTVGGESELRKDAQHLARLVLERDWRRLGLSGRASDYPLQDAAAHVWAAECQPCRPE